MRMTIAEVFNEWQIFILSEDDEVLARFALQDEKAADAFYLSLLTPEQAEAEKAAIEAAWAIDVEDAANRQLGYTR
jgi:hypothetical protein